MTGPGWTDLAGLTRTCTYTTRPGPPYPTTLGTPTRPVTCWTSLDTRELEVKCVVGLNKQASKQ